MDGWRLPLTFGVEVEFLVPWKYSDETDPHKDVKGLAPLSVIAESRREWIEAQDDPEGEVGFILYDSIRRTLRQHGLATQYTGSGAVGTPEAPAHTTFVIDEDRSLREVEDETYSNDTWPQQTQWVGVELNSPAAPDAPRAYETLMQAVNLVKARFRCRVNPTCSVHVHVGRGPEYLPLEQVRRLGALCFAADPLLFALHDPARRVSGYAPSVFEYSNLAQGRSPSPAHAQTNGDSSNSSSRRKAQASCVRYMGVGVRHGEAPISWREEHLRCEAAIGAFEGTRREGHYEPFRRPCGGEGGGRHHYHLDRSILGGTILDCFILDRPVLHRTILDITATITAPNTDPRTTTLTIPATIPPARRGAQARHPTRALPNRAWQRRREGGVDVFRGAEAIFAAESSCVVHELLRPAPADAEQQQRLGGSGGRGAISFAGYACAKLGKSACAGGRRNGGKRDKRTVEFRAASGCCAMGTGTEGRDDPAFLEHWARICVGLVRFAATAPPVELLRVLEGCDAATTEEEGGGGAYDVVDLLRDMGLFAEAEAAERRIREHREEWGLEYHEETPTMGAESLARI
ncbi:hypothetical protein GGR56DRAFT_681403 [Xylariaceae sp. FL0804]|nr:hypothetical protein GGR56DRAFT_681403 [Xylariaceae sp. FL0804]